MADEDIRYRLNQVEFLAWATLILVGQPPTTSAREHTLRLLAAFAASFVAMMLTGMARGWYVARTGAGVAPEKAAIDDLAG